MSKRPPLPETCTMREACALLDLSQTELRRYVSTQDLPAQVKRGQYRLAELVVAWGELRFRQGQREAPSLGEMEEARKDYWKAKASREGVEAERARGDSVGREDVFAILDACLGGLAQELDQLPGRLAAELANQNNPATVKARLLEEFDRARSTVADRIEEHRARLESGGDAPATAAEPERPPVGG